jgi:hypothetical protein
MCLQMCITNCQGDSSSPLFYNNFVIRVNDGTAPLFPQDIHPETVNFHIHILYYYDFIFY